ncbi:MAG: hypothetical protein LBQ98_01305 [Nitrososphaerota archaeon]|nr:hypothetical protein [Nitrososphaerota archaeon]
MEATITLEYPDKKTANAVAKAVSPDNLKTLAGLQLKTIQENTQVITDIHCDSNLSTFISTIDDLLFCATVAEKAIKVIKP